MNKKNLSYYFIFRHKRIPQASVLRDERRSGEAGVYGEKEETPSLRAGGGFIFLLFSFFLTRLINLTLLPIFNDEAIYLDWGQRMINTPGLAFYSLYDGKQPFLMWIFGITNKFIADPLIAGRLVSVVLGGLGLLGIYLLSGLFLTFPFRLLPPIVYTLVPIFVFFDRQALMESAICSVGIWSFYFLTCFLKEKKLLFPFILGGTLGFGLFIKSSAGIFFLLTIIILVYSALKEKRFKDKQKLFGGALLVLFLTFMILLPLVIQPDFGNIIKGSSRFNLMFSELASFPFTRWLKNLLSFWEISFWYLTPPLLLLAILGMWVAFKKQYFLLLFWFLASLAMSVFTARNLNPRYVTSLLPLVSILAALGMTFLLKKQKFIGYLAVSLLVFPLYVTFLLIFKPLDYFNLFQKFAPGFSQRAEYVTNNPSGYGMDKVRNWLEEKAKERPIYVGVRLDAGNPENTLMAYYFKNPAIVVIYFDKQLIRPEVSVDKIVFDRSLYFVSRSEHRAGLEDYLVEEAKFYKPEGKSYFGIYRFVPKSQGSIKKREI